jgi:hypothetical protein
MAHETDAVDAMCLRCSNRKMLPTYDDPPRASSTRERRHRERSLEYTSAPLPVVAAALPVTAVAARSTAAAAHRHSHHPHRGEQRAHASIHGYVESACSSSSGSSSDDDQANEHKYDRDPRRHHRTHQQEPQLSSAQQHVIHAPSAVPPSLPPQPPLPSEDMPLVQVLIVPTKLPSAATTRNNEAMPLQPRAPALAAPLYQTPHPQQARNSSSMRASAAPLLLQAGPTELMAGPAAARGPTARHHAPHDAVVSHKKVKVPHFHHRAAANLDMIALGSSISSHRSRRRHRSSSRKHRHSHQHRRRGVSTSSSDSRSRSRSRERDRGRERKHHHRRERSRSRSARHTSSSRHRRREERRADRSPSPRALQAHQAYSGHLYNQQVQQLVSPQRLRIHAEPAAGARSRPLSPPPRSATFKQPSKLLMQEQHITRHSGHKRSREDEVEQPPPLRASPHVSSGLR